MLPAYKFSVYALQWLLPDTAQDSIIDVLGCTFDAFTFRCQLFYTSWRTAAFCIPCIYLCTPGMGVNLWGESPLCVNPAMIC